MRIGNFDKIVPIEWIQVVLYLFLNPSDFLDFETVHELN